MQFKQYKEENQDELDDDVEYQHKKNSKQVKRKWREIEALKEQKRAQREIASYDDYVTH